MVLCLVSAASAAPPVTSTSVEPIVAPRIMAKAKEWFRRFQTGRIDRSQLQPEVSQQLTQVQVEREGALLRRFGAPTDVVFMRSGPVSGAMGYDFLLIFTSGRVAESIAFDNKGKIAGIDFQIFVPKETESPAPLRR